MKRPLCIELNIQNPSRIFNGMCEFETVTYSVSKSVAIIALNRPKALNSFNAQLRRDLLVALETANSDDLVRVIVLTGEGRAFSAGADIVEGFPQDTTIEDQILQEYLPFLLAIHRCEKIVISAINGACAGIGVGVALSSDLAVMADDSYLYLAFAAIGLVPDGGVSWQLVNTLGYKRALQLVVESAKISAIDCLEFGLVNKVLPADRLLEQTKDWAETLAKGAPIVHKQTKHLLQSVRMKNLEEAVCIEAKAQNVAMASQDHKNALRAFSNKTEVEFTGY